MQKQADLNKLVDELLCSICLNLAEQKEIKKVFQASDPFIACDLFSLERALKDLLLTALVKIHSQDFLSIETKNLEISENFQNRMPWVQAGSYCVLSIKAVRKWNSNLLSRDSFDENSNDAYECIDLENACETIKNCGGFIEFYCVEFGGVNIDIFLPAKISKPAGSSLPRKKTILFAEDDNFIRRITKDILESAGYEVLTAKDGVEACELFFSNKEKVALALLDISMPRKGGMEAYQTIIRHMPELPVLFSSGYGCIDSEDSMLLDSPIQMIRKPYSSADLICSVRSALGE